MTSSGVLLSKRPISELIDISFSYCQINVEEEALTPEEYKRALSASNQMLRTWQAEGFHLWQYKEGILFLEKNRTNYPFNGDVYVNVPNTGRDFRPAICVRADQLAKSELVSDAGSGDDEITINFNDFYDDDGKFYLERFPNTETLVGWIIGYAVPQSTYMAWDVITDDVLASNPNNLSNHRTITLENGLISPPDNIDITFVDYPAGTIFYLYPPTATLNDVERVLDVRRVQQLKLAGSNETPINFMSHQEWYKLPNRDTAGTPNQATFDRLSEFGVMRVWQQPAVEITYQLAFTYERTFQKFVNVSDTADFARYWEDAFCWNLAYRLAIEFRVPPDIKQEIKAMADETINNALSYDNANYNMRIQLNNRVRR